MVFLIYRIGYLLIHFFLLFILLFMGKLFSFNIVIYLSRGLYLDFFVMGDFLSLSFLCFVSLITFRVMIYREIYISLDRSSKRFIVLVRFFVLSIFILILRPSFLIIILGWDGLGVTSFLLVIYYNNNSSLTSGLVTIYLNRVGDFFIILSFWVLYGQLRFSIENFLLGGNNSFFFFRILLARITKRAQLPFSSWLPAAIAAPTPVSSLVHSSTLVTAGVYIIIRFFYLTESNIISSLIVWISLLTCIRAGIIACCENDLKKLVAISTLRQLGLIVFTYSLGEIFYSFYHIVCHALFKALLFLGCGFCIINIYGLQDSRGIMKIGSLLFLNLILVGIAVISLLGFPFTAGFYSKDSIIEVCILVNTLTLIIIFLILCCILTGLYALKVLLLTIKSNNNSNSSFIGIFFIKIFLGILFLSIWSISLGKVFFYVIQKTESSLILLYLKVIGLIIVFLGFIISFQLFWTKMFILETKSFFGDMFFLNWFYGNLRRSRVEKIAWLTLGELRWLLYLGPRGIYSLVKSLGSQRLSYMGGVRISLVFFVGLFLIGS